MAAGADMAAVSMHKSGGSLTQSSMLLIGPAMSEGYVRAVINLTQTTSASYLLLASLDISRRNLALRGQETMTRVAALAEYARAEINAIGDYDAFSKERINGTSFFDFDITKLSVHTLGSAWPGSKSMICCATNTASRSNSATSAIFWPMCPSATASARSSASSAPWPICAAASGAPVRPVC